MYNKNKDLFYNTERIFHYTSSKVALEKILFTQEIKISQIKYTNDPREAKEWALLPKYIGIPFGSSPQQQLVINQGFTKIKLEEWKVICFSINSPKYKRRREHCKKY